MKKIIIIVILLIFNFCVVCAKISNTELDKVELKLTKDELGIVTFNLKNSTSLLFKYHDKYYLYIYDFDDSKNIKNSEEVFTSYVDYIFMNNNYNYHDSRAKIVKNEVVDDLIFTDDKIMFKDSTICINQSTNCDYVFINREDVLISKDNKAVFYSNELNEKYVDYLKSFWIDTYLLSDESYTVVTIGDDYSVESLVK